MDNDERVTVSRRQRTCTLRVIDLTVANLARIFQIQQQTMYMIERDSGVVVFPTHDHFSFVDLTAGMAYTVEGQEVTPAPTAGPSGGSGASGFRFPPQSAQPRPPAIPPKRKYSRPIVVAKKVDGNINLESYITTINFDEDEANVASIATVIKFALDSQVEIILTDGKGRQILPSPGTSGLEYWRRGARKVVAFGQDLFEEFCRNKRRRSSQGQMSGVQVAIEEFIQVAEALPNVAAEMREMGRDRLTRQQVDILKATVQCLICRSDMERPILSVCCRSLIGCQQCIGILFETNSTCPKCRAPMGEDGTIAVAGLSEAIAIIRGL